MSFSQFGEDEIVAKLLLTEPGNLIEIGAWEPQTFSNSRLFIECGWDATLIEFSPEPVRQLVKEYAGNPKVRVIAAAVTPDAQHVMEFAVTDDACTTVPENAAKWKGLRAGYDGGFFGQLWVPTLSVQQLLDQFYGDRQVDFLSVDTEGSSVEIAIEFMQSGWAPKVLCVEYGDRLVWLVEQAQLAGYKQEWLNGVNVILVKR
jgi:Methyltransferase FkbM domain